MFEVMPPDTSALHTLLLITLKTVTAQKMKYSITDFFFFCAVSINKGRFLIL